MPLTVNNGTALNPEAAPPAVEHSVDIQHRPQEGRLWCWAACIQMVLEHNNKEISQCEIVRTKLGNMQHLCVENRNLRNESCDAVLMAKAWRDCGIKQVIPSDEVPDIDDIKSEIAAGRPIEVGILWDEDEGGTGGGHVVLIKGWISTNPEVLLIDDPLRQSSLGESKFESGQATRDELLKAFGHGKWRYTWANLH